MASLRNIIEGIQLLATYLPDGLDSRDTWADHDVFGVAAGDTSLEDVTTLEALGWHYDDQTDCWLVFV